jgi:hypothetical protein
MQGVAEAKQLFGQIGAILPGHAGEERNAPLRILNRHIYLLQQNAELPISSSTLSDHRTLRWAGP